MTKGNGKSKSLEQQIVDRLDKVVARMERGFEDLNTRLDKVIENTGAHWRHLDDRLRVIEDKLGIK